MVADADFSDYLQARWPLLVAALEREGVASAEAHLAVAEVLVANRRGWRRLVDEESVDVHVWQALRERAGLPDQPGSTPPVTTVGVDPTRPVDRPEPWLERAEALRRRRRWRDVRRYLLGLVAAALVVAALVWWGSRPDVREETNPLPVPWYAGEELHLAEVVVELPDVDSFVAFGDGAAVRLEDGEVIEVDGDGDVSALDDPPQDLVFPPSLPDYLPFGRYTYVVQGTVLPDGGRAFVLDSRRGDRNNSLQIPTSSHRVLVLCEPGGSCRKAEGGIPAEGFRLR